nr:integrase, catalytic region, zinc finger, CCHC-type, peptidase aspartic, catalytic [Tanacetum cinerariifolium]
NPFKTSREEKHVPNNVRASARTKSITVSQHPVITKKDLNSDSNGLSSTGIDNTKIRRPQPRSNIKNDKVPFASKSSRSKMKGAEVEEHHRNLLLSKNTKHMSSACNNIKLDSQNVISKVVCAMCKQCLISVNHDVCLYNYVNGKNSRGKKHKTNVSIKEKQKKHQPQVKKPKTVGFIERLATPKPKKPRFLLRWSPTGRLLTKKKFMGTVRFKNDHVAVILGFGDLQWRNILITRIYFVEGLGHNLFSVGQFCDSDLEVAFRRNACFIRNLEACASSTKSWLWHQRLSHLNFNTINDLAINDLVFGLPKFKYHKEHLYPSQAARTMLIFSRAPLFLWAEAIATACFIQNRSIIHRRFNKTPYELINKRKPDISFLYVFGALCYPKNDREDIWKLGAKGDIGFFIGYSADSCAYRIFNRRTKKIIETMNVSFDKLSAMAFEQRSSKLGLQRMTSGQINSGLNLTYAPSTITTQQPTECELDLLFEAMYDDYIGGQPQLLQELLRLLKNHKFVSRQQHP